MSLGDPSPTNGSLPASSAVAPQLHARCSLDIVNGSSTSTAPLFDYGTTLTILSIMGKLATSYDQLARDRRAMVHAGKRLEDRSSMKEEPPSKIVKRRTKTGCLTCRHRRVKCGEEKPICFNCVKSKRKCQGYGQRVVFKDPVGVHGLLRGLSTHNDNQAQPPAYDQQQQQYPSIAEDVSIKQPVSTTDHDEGVNTYSFHSLPAQGPPEAVTERAALSSDISSQQHSQQHTAFPNHCFPRESSSSPYDSSWDVARGAQKQQLYQPHGHNQPTTPTIPVGGSVNKYGIYASPDSMEETDTDDFERLRSIMADPNRDGSRLRTFSTHLNEPNILASYRPTFGSSPLNNPKTAKVFAHFVHSVAPSISVFERHPVEIPIMLGSHIPAPQQGLWTYTLALQALEHPALLQAILAISSLHISFLQRAPQTVSLKHYHYALKRVGNAVGLPTRRQQYGTLAATLLLGYYEVVAADHSKWNSHVAGSAHLVREIDYARMTRDLRQFRRSVRAQQAGSGTLFAGSSPNDESEEDPFAEKESSIDQHLIGSLMGRAVNYDEFGQVEDGSSQPYQNHFTAKDIETFRIQCDLYWWYCKQDTFQSIISGHKLFMPYYQWGQCPPRAGMGRLDAIYGTADHLWLLLGRLTDFGYRDRKRKLKSLNSSGTDWKPNPGFFKIMARFGRGNMRGPPPTRVPFGPAHDNQERRGPNPAPASQPKEAGGPRQENPPMYGMVPPRGPVRLPSAFVDNPHRMDQADRDDDGYEDATYSNAENEWENILSAFDSFAQALGRDFMPLAPAAVPSISTPFGPSLQYRTQTIAVLWAFYYTGRIVLLRLHPSMPPAMMVAAGAAASTTVEYAQAIGRIAAGVYYPHLLNIEADQLSPTLGSCLIEMTPPLLFAGVQYVDPAQRAWTVVNLRNVSRLTGWKTSDSIASGCERCWFMAGKQGRGPPYQPTNDERLPFSEPLSHQKGDRQSQTGGYDNPEKRFVTMSKARRVHWAMGVLSLEDDILNLDLNDRV